MIDLTNTWCYATEENYNKLISLGYENPIGGLKDNYIFTSSDKDHKYFCCYVTNSGVEWKDKARQIHLVDGEFQYVEENEKPRHIEDDMSKINNFEDFGFTADFEGEIIKETKSGMWLGSFADPVNYSDIVPCLWSKSGKCLVNDEPYNQYNLTPIKKAWYEDKSNFPCFATHRTSLEVYKANNYIDNSLLIENELRNVEYFRPATKEEVLKLILKDCNETV